MTVAEVLRSVQFVVGQDGRQTGVFLDMAAWKALMDWLEDVEDAQIVRERLRGWHTKEGWTPWEKTHCTN